jgi:hypothetical protein
VVPPPSDRVSRAPPYSRTPAHPCPYGAVTRSGAPFQTLPVREQRPLAWSAFARHYLRSRSCFPFLRLLRCFSSPGSPPPAMDSLKDTAKKRWVAPFGHPRINERSPLPWAFRSVPRPSSPLGAKASTRCPSPTKLAHVQPQARKARLGRGQMSEIRCQKDPRPAIRPPPFLLISALCSLFSEPGREPPGLAPWRQHTHVHKVRAAAGSGSHPNQPAPRALRSRLSLHDVKVQMSDIRDQMSEGAGACGGRTAL